MDSYNPDWPVMVALYKGDVLFTVNVMLYNVKSYLDILITKVYK